MNQKLSVKVKLLSFSNGPLAFGNDQGRETLQKLQKYISDHQNEEIFSISLEGMQATDASFPRESVVSLVKMLKGEKGIYLCDFPTNNNDMFDNWRYAADAKSQHIIVKLNKGYDVIGPDLPGTSKDLLDYIMSKKAVTTSEIAAKYDISAQNASARLKKLYELGLILGQKQTAESGGLEYVYSPIK